MEEGREVCRAGVLGGERATCLHFVWNEEQDEGCVKGTKEGQCTVCVLFLNVFVFFYEHEFECH